MKKQSLSSLDPLERFADAYGRERSEAERSVEREVFGTDEGIISYTTPEQAGALATALGLGPGVLLLEVGSGFGWPGLYLAERSGCHALLTDVPAGAVRMAAARALKRNAEMPYAFALASGTQLPVRPRSIDAVVHSDVL